MALILNPYGGGTIVGKLGGKVFQRGSFGQVVRNLALPVNPATPRQLTIKASMSVLAFFWNNTLTVTERKTWTDYAVVTPVQGTLGTQIYLAGRSWYIKSNLYKLSIGLTPLNTAPLTPGEGQGNNIILTGTTGDGLEVDSLQFPLTAGDRVIFQTSPPLHPSKQFFKGPWIQTDNFNEPVDSFPFTLKLPANVAVGQRYYVNSRIYGIDRKVSPEFKGVVDIT